jgi:hypothetical protein
LITTNPRNDVLPERKDNALFPRTREHCRQTLSVAGFIQFLSSIAETNEPPLPVRLTFQLFNRYRRR